MKLLGAPEFGETSRVGPDAGGNWVAGIRVWTTSNFALTWSLSSLSLSSSLVCVRACLQGSAAQNHYHPFDFSWDRPSGQVPSRHPRSLNICAGPIVYTFGPQGCQRTFGVTTRYVASAGEAFARFFAMSCDASRIDASLVSRLAMR